MPGTGTNPSFVGFPSLYVFHSIVSFPETFRPRLQLYCPYLEAKSNFADYQFLLFSCDFSVRTKRVFAQKRVFGLRLYLGVSGTMIRAKTADFDVNI